MAKASEYFGELIFNKKVMREKLSKETYRKLLATIEEGEPFDQSIAADVAHAMKEWALQHGATHYTHWFQPQRGATAEKHDAFITYAENGELIERLSAQQLIQSEPDASSFPSGGIRSTFEARGYTAWDPTSPAFLMQTGRSKTLIIPSVFLAWTGDVLDMKTPFLRSQKALNNAVLKIQKILGNDIRRTKVFLGPEQEYFLIDKSLYHKRPDLQICNRTIFGAAPEKGQQMSNHYFGSIKRRVIDFMAELDFELYRQGIPAKTRHNEVSPNQFEIAPLYEEANLAIDHNLRMMETIKRTAEKFDLVAILHEKPFARLNGSGKHMNWSIGDDQGINYLEPSKSPEKNIIFLITIGSVLMGVKKYGGLLRAGVADAGNDFRLGGHEAPPAIMSVYLGSYLDKIFTQIENLDTITEQTIEHINLDIQKLPQVARDVSDRNRTSPIAFTGNKFEFRAVGSSQNCSESAMIFNLIVAYGFREFAKLLPEKSQISKKSIYKALSDILKETKSVRFEGNNYSEIWQKEATRRGLPLAENTPDSLNYYLKPETIELFTKFNTLSQRELVSKISIKMESYQQTKLIESKTAINMTNTIFLPVIIKYIDELSSTSLNLKKIDIDCSTLKKEIETLLNLYKNGKQAAEKIKELIKTINSSNDVDKNNQMITEDLEKQMRILRENIDKAERLIPDSLWPLPKYRELLAEL